MFEQREFDRPYLWTRCSFMLDITVKQFSTHTSQQWTAWTLLVRIMFLQCERASWRRIWVCVSPWFNVWVFERVYTCVYRCADWVVQGNHSSNLITISSSIVTIFKQLNALTVQLYCTHWEISLAVIWTQQNIKHHKDILEIIEKKRRELKAVRP